MNGVVPLFHLMSLRLDVEAHEHLYLYFPSVLCSLVHLFVFWNREIFPSGVMQPQLEAKILTSSVLTVQSACNFSLVFRYVLSYRCFSTRTPAGLLSTALCVLTSLAWLRKWAVYREADSPVTCRSCDWDADVYRRRCSGEEHSSAQLLRVTACIRQPSLCHKSLVHVRVQQFPGNFELVISPSYP